MFDVRYKGLRLIPSKSAMRELIEYGLCLDDCRQMLEEEYEAPRRRAEGTEEKWIDKGKKTYNIVVAKSFNYFYGEEVYLLIHVGKFSRGN